MFDAAKIRQLLHSLDSHTAPRGHPDFELHEEIGRALGWVEVKRSECEWQGPDARYGCHPRQLPNWSGDFHDAALLVPAGWRVTMTWWSEALDRHDEVLISAVTASGEKIARRSVNDTIPRTMLRVALMLLLFAHERGV